MADKKLLLMATIIFSVASHSYTLSFKTIAEKMADRCVLSPNGSIKFSGVFLRNQDPQFHELVLTADGLSYNYNAQIPLGIVLHLASCSMPPKKRAVMIEEYALKNGIDITLVTQAIYENEPIFIVGARWGDEQSPQLFIDKNSFLPIRELTRAHRIEFKKWQMLEMVDKKKFPRLMTVKNPEDEFSLSMSEKLLPALKEPVAK